MNWITKLVYGLGLLAFVGSFYFPATADKMTSQYGEKVEVWYSPGSTHLKLALEPVTEVWAYINLPVDPDAHGDGREIFQRECIEQALLFLPVSFGWLCIWISVVLMPWTWMRPIMNLQFRRFLRIAGGVMLVAVLVLVRDYYGWATVYEGYFHLGFGAYLVVIAYLFVGASLLLEFAGKRRHEQSAWLLRELESPQ